MTWTYNTALAESRDKVRFLVQDTDTNEQLLQDEEIDFILTEDSNIYRAAAKGCRAIGLYYTRQVSFEENDLIQDAQLQAEKYLRMAIEFDMRGSTGVFAGGISVADKESREEDTDRPEPAFTVATHQ